MQTIALCILVLSAFALVCCLVLLNRAQKHCDDAIKICEDAVKSLREKGI